MVSEEPTDGRCNARAGENGWGYCESYPVTDGDGAPRNGRCRMHGGTNPGGAREGSGAPENNQNAATHRMTAAPSKLYENLSEENRALVDGVHDSNVAQLAERWGGRENIPEVHITHSRRVAMNVLKVTVFAEDWQYEEAKKSGNPLIETKTREADSGETYEVDITSLVEDVASDLARENRMWLKDMGILGSPEEQQADAASEVAAAWKESADAWRMKRVESDD